MGKRYAYIVKNEYGDNVTVRVDTPTIEAVKEEARRVGVRFTTHMEYRLLHPNAPAARA